MRIKGLRVFLVFCVLLTLSLFSPVFAADPRKEILEKCADAEGWSASEVLSPKTKFAADSLPIDYYVDYFSILDCYCSSGGRWKEGGCWFYWKDIVNFGKSIGYDVENECLWSTNSDCGEKTRECKLKCWDLSGDAAAACGENCANNVQFPCQMEATKQCEEEFKSKVFDYAEAQIAAGHGRKMFDRHEVEAFKRGGDITEDDTTWWENLWGKFVRKNEDIASDVGKELLLTYKDFIKRFGEETEKGQMFKTEDDTIVWVGKDGTKVKVVKDDFFDAEQWKKLVGSTSVIALEDGVVVMRSVSSEKYLAPIKSGEVANNLLFGDKSIVEYNFDSSAQTVSAHVYKGTATLYSFDPSTLEKRILVSAQKGEYLTVDLEEYASYGIRGVGKGNFDVSEENEGVTVVAAAVSSTGGHSWIKWGIALLVGGSILVVLVKKLKKKAHS